MSTAVETRITEALQTATDTRALRLGDGVLAETPAVFRDCFGERPALIVADVNTFMAAGRAVLDHLREAGIDTREPLIFDQPELHATHEHMEALQAALAGHDAIAIAVGSGTVNDLAKLASHRCGRPYLAVATAASMDGYTAYGASVTYQGSKQTFFCPAPVGVIADMTVIGNAPPELNAAGYGDLVAKSPAGADWMLADALGLEPIDERGWTLVQTRFRECAGDPHGVRRGDGQAIRALIEGLLMTGLAMQHCRSSRPASGAEHQFSHLWDMQNHRHQGRVPLHGCKVAVGALASTRLYEALLRRPLEELVVEAACASWPTEAELGDRVRQLHRPIELRSVAWEELRSKYIDRCALRARLDRLKSMWPALRDRLRRQLIPSSELEHMLDAAGTPHAPPAIGISPARMRRSFLQAQQIRRRYTVLDLATETGLMPTCLDELFGAAGADDPRATAEEIPAGTDSRRPAR